MKKIAIVGAGGINSWAVHFLNELFMKLEDAEYFIQIFDNDIVEEKNIMSGNQNFTAEDLMEQKAEVLAKRYGLTFENIFITEENISLLSNFDDIILGVDNNKVRQMVYKHCLENNIFLLDLRAQGTQIAYFVLDHEKGMDYYNKLHFNNPEVMERKGSCQLQSDIESGKVEMGNYIIACLGINACYLKHKRKEKLSTNEWRFAY